MSYKGYDKTVEDVDKYVLAERLELIRSKVLEKAANITTDNNLRHDFVNNCMSSIDDFDISNLNRDAINSEFLKLRALINEQIEIVLEFDFWQK